MTTITDTPDRPRSRSVALRAYPLAQRLLIGLALLLGAALLYSGSQLLRAGIASYQAQAFLDDWGSKGAEPSPRAWQIAHDAAQRAIALYPVANGEYLERLGHIQQWQHHRQPFGAAAAEASRRAALEAFRAASQARPSWPYTWSALAYAKLYLLEFDGEFAHALQQAQRLGPTRIDINRRLAEIGLIAWPQLDAQQRQASLEAAQRTLAYSPREAAKLMAIAEHAGMSGPLCQQISDALKASRKLCQ